ncbi:hypothetical protein, partial [Nereida ignava]|uniref:hypothetical protein n=1 Tax=Nereida ignava TaxID=282199 RepID=UPI0030FD1953
QDAVPHGVAALIRRLKAERKKLVVLHATAATEHDADAVEQCDKAAADLLQLLMEARANSESVFI